MRKGGDGLHVGAPLNLIVPVIGQAVAPFNAFAPSMRVAVMQIGIMRVTVAQRRMLVRMGVGNAWRIMGEMAVIVMRIVGVQVIVGFGGMDMLVRMALPW